MEINNLAELKALYKSYNKRGNPRIKSYQSCSCTAGHLHHSRGEAQYCSQLHFLKDQGKIQEIKTQVHYDLKVNGKKICGIRPDFLVTYPDGSQKIIEYKGFATEVWSIKWALFRALHPDLDCEVVGGKDLW